MPRLFDEFPRTHLGPALGAESHFHFYNRSALPAVDRLRKMLQRWVNRLPVSKQKDIVNRMRHTGTGSRTNDRSFDSAFFEMALHEFLRGTGRYVEVEPVVDGRTPDFSIAATDGPGEARRFYVEALDISTIQGTELEISWNEKKCEDALNEIESPDFYLYVQASGVLDTTPRKSKLKAPFERLLDRVDYQAVWEKYKDAGNWNTLPSATFRHGDWELQGTLLPVSPGHRPKGPHSRFVGIGFGGGGVIDDVGKVRGRLYDKAKRYQRIPQLIIAARTDEWADRINEVLFGTQTYNFYANTDPHDTRPIPEPHPGQAMNGFWFNSSGPQNMHVVGVLLFNTLYPHCVHKAQTTFFANPYVEVPLPTWTRAISHAEYRDGRIAIVDGVPPSAYIADHEAIDDLFVGTSLSRTARAQ